MQLKPLLASNLKSLRRKKNLSQAQVAEAIDMHPTKYSEIERSMRWPRESTLKLIAECFEVEPSRLFADPSIIDNDLILERVKQALSKK